MSVFVQNPEQCLSFAFVLENPWRSKNSLRCTEREKQKKKWQHHSYCFHLQAQGLVVQPSLVAGEEICAQGFLVMQLCCTALQLPCPADLLERCSGLCWQKRAVGAG